MTSSYIINLPAGLISWRRTGERCLQLIESNYKITSKNAISVDGANILVLSIEVDVFKPNSIDRLLGVCAEAAELIGVDRIGVYSCRADLLYGANLGSPSFSCTYRRDEFVLPDGRLLS